MIYVVLALPLLGWIAGTAFEDRQYSLFVVALALIFSLIFLSAVLEKTP